MCLCVFFCLSGGKEGRERAGGEGGRRKGEREEREYENMYVGYVSL